MIKISAITFKKMRSIVDGINASRYASLKGCSACLIEHHDYKTYILFVESADGFITGLDAEFIGENTATVVTDILAEQLSEWRDIGESITFTPASNTVH